MKMCDQCRGRGQLLHPLRVTPRQTVGFSSMSLEDQAQIYGTETRPCMKCFGTGSMRLEVVDVQADTHSVTFICEGGKELYLSPQNLNMLFKLYCKKPSAIDSSTAVTSVHKYPNDPKGRPQDGFGINLNNDQTLFVPMRFMREFLHTKKEVVVRKRTLLNKLYLRWLAFNRWKENKKSWSELWCDDYGKR